MDRWPTVDAYVDDGNQRIQKLSPNGTILQSHWGGFGRSDGPLSPPSGIAVDSHDNVYVGDVTNHRIQKLSPDGTPLVSWGSHGTDAGQFDSPRVKAVDRSGNIYVVDNTKRLQKLSPFGETLAVWEDIGYGVSGVAVDGSGNVYLVDYWRNTIQKLSPDGTPHQVSWGGGGSGDGQFNHPYGVAVDSSGNVYVTDNEYDRVLKFSQKGTLTVEGVSTK